MNDGTRCQLPEKEAELLEYLASNAGRVISREELLSRIWRVNPKAVETRTVDMHIARLRDRLKDDPENPRIIVTVRGRGYIFEAHP
jgi:DNA-binding response OmpR family regulator